MMEPIKRLTILEENRYVKEKDEEKNMCRAQAQQSQGDCLTEDRETGEDGENLDCFRGQKEER